MAELSRQLQQAAERLKQLEMATAREQMNNAQQSIARAKAGLDAQRQVRVEVRENRNGNKEDDILVSPKIAPGSNYAPARRAPGASNRDPEADRDRRLDAVKRQLSQLLNEVKRLRSDREGSVPPSAAR